MGVHALHLTEQEGVELLGYLAMRLVERVEARMAPLQAALAAKLAELSPAEVQALPTARFTIASSKYSHVPR